ncbi:threonylcarbamoyl-AMP synthase [Candidatus Saccharibacteria bacterium RIFCSPHIGHO2_12_FULL_47_16b]|nr:MAG: threonylcarbamoyl-AMP synthase [Candidatus Saccharibacteria bacterium RIFCSPHIGHO2_12_FULL_47_16b]OGL40615.1 MAG: threonylcarbamoyl-AMP synthase [Candidatus Saccharibacteria bacterium RIFCSPLOWO2_02_FULL_46_7]
MTYIAKSFDKKVVELLKGGAVGFMPSDTIYGLSCRALAEKAVAKIYELKGRSYTKPLIVLISNLRMLDSLGIRYNKVIKSKYWPGPLTIILAAPKAPSWLTRGSGQLAIRWSAYQELNELINKVGPLVSTSANPEGGQPAESVEQAQKYFGELLDFYIEAGKLKARPSTIAELKNDKLKILRQGELLVKKEDMA